MAVAVGLGGGKGRCGSVCVRLGAHLVHGKSRLDPWGIVRPSSDQPPRRGARRLEGTRSVAIALLLVVATPRGVVPVRVVCFFFLLNGARLCLPHEQLDESLPSFAILALARQLRRQLQNALPLPLRRRLL